MPDFVGCLDWAWQESGNKSMGDDFNFVEWCDQWLKTSGVNILEPVVEYNEDFSIKSLHIKQTCDLRGKNRLRMQKVKIALFHGEDLQAHVVDVLISDKEEMNKVIVDFDGPVRAIFTNYEDHAYALTRYDERTLDFIINNLSLVKTDLERAVVWQQMWIMVMSCKMSPLTYFQFVVKQLPHEPSQQIVGEAIKLLAELIDNYIPPSLISDCTEKMFDLLMALLQKGNEDLTVPVADKIFDFISGKDSVNLALSWIDKGFIHTADAPEEKVFKLNESNMRSIGETLFKTSYLSTERKMQLLE